MSRYKKAIEMIGRARTVVVAGHVNPDGDCIGSMLALGLALKDLNKEVFMLVRQGMPAKYKLLPGAGSIERTIDRKVDLAIAVDCGDKRLLGKNSEVFDRAGEILEIDHHLNRKPFASRSIIDSESSSTGQIIYRLIRRMGLNMTKDIAENILTSIIVETGSFQFPNVRPGAFKVCYELLTGFDIDYYRVATRIFWYKSKEETLLSGVALSRARFFSRGKAVWSIIREKDFRNFGGGDADVDSVGAELLATLGVEIAGFSGKNREVFYGSVFVPKVLLTYRL